MCTVYAFVAQACFGLVITMLSRLFDISSVADEFAALQARVQAAIGVVGRPPRKKRCAVDAITQSPSKSACAVGNVIRKTRRALDVRSGQDKFKAAIGDERATSCAPGKNDSSREGHVIPHAMLCHTMSCYATPCHAVPSHAMP